MTMLRSARERAAYGITCLAGLAVGLMGGRPRDFGRVVVARPTSLEAHVGSLLSWLDYLIPTRPLHAVVGGLCAAGLVLVVALHREAER